MRAEFTTTDITKVLGVPRERLKDWMNAGFVAPSIPASGAGTKALFSINDLYAIQLFQHLIVSGLKRKDAAEVVGRFHYEASTGDFLIAKATEGMVMVEMVRIGDARPILDLISGVPATIGSDGVAKTKRGLAPNACDPSLDGSKKRGVYVWDHMLVINVVQIRRLVDNKVADL